MAPPAPPIDGQLLKDDDVMLPRLGGLGPFAKEPFRVRISLYIPL